MGGEPTTYVERFEAMVEELRRHPEVTVHRCRVAPPVDEATIDRVQAELRLRLSDEVLTLYRQANGLELVWCPSSKIEGRIPNEAELADPFLRMSHEHVGLINVRPLERLLEEPAPNLIRRARPFDDYGVNTLVAFDLPPRRASSWDAQLTVHEGGEGVKLSRPYQPLGFWDYLEGVLAVYGSCRARQRALFFAAHGTHGAGFDARHLTSETLDAVVAECRMNDYAWDGYLSRFKSSRRPVEVIVPGEVFDFGVGPRLGDDLVFVCPFSVVPKKVEGLPNWMASWVIVYGGDGPVGALARDHPDSETADEVRAFEEQMSWSMFQFMVMNDYRPNVRVPPDSRAHIQQNLSLDEIRAYFDARGVRAVTVEEVGLIHDPAVESFFPAPAGLRVEPVRPIHRQWMAHRRRLLGLLRHRALG